MATAPQVVMHRWRSRQLSGQARHQLIVRVRRGYMDRVYQPLDMLGGGPLPELGQIWKGQNSSPWQGQWTPVGDWMTLPEVQSAKWARDTQSDNGSSTLTVVLDNVAFTDEHGPTGMMYHEIQRGYYSPQRGVRVALRRNLWSQNQWVNVLNGGYQVELWEGYGPDGDPSVTPLDVADPDTGSCEPPDAAIARTWTGIIDSLDLDSHPDQMTVTARDFGIFFTDQRVIYQNKAPEIRSPVIFADRARVLGEQRTSYQAQASGSRPGYSPAKATDNSDETGWVSDGQDSRDDLVWLEIRVPAGYYTQFFLATEFAGLEMWVAVKGENGTHWNAGAIGNGDWVNGGLGNVPGTGVPFVNHYKTLGSGGGRKNLNGLLHAGEGAVLRVYFSKLSRHMYSNTGDRVALDKHVAGVFRFFAYRYDDEPTAKNLPTTEPGNKGPKVKGWVLVSDLADIARRVFLWAGFKEMDCENFGWSLAQPMPFGQDQYFIDIITACQNQGNFLFYMAQPTNDDMSIGVPTFKKQEAFALQPQTTSSIRDTDLLEGLSVKYDLSNLPYSVRVRGSQNKSGTTFGRDLVKRFHGVYYPPWSGIDYRKISPTRKGLHMDHSERLSGLKRNYLQTQGQTIRLALSSNAQCMFVAVLTAVQYALEAMTAQFQMPGLPGVELNTAFNVIDEGTGTNTRVWVSSIESDHKLGEDGSWHMTLSGSLLDTDDLNLMAEDWAYVVHKYSMEKG